jgi:hypothetical protein
LAAAWYARYNFDVGSSRRPTIWISRPEQRDREYVKTRGQMSQSGIMPNEEIGMSDHPSHRKQIEIL